ncbi:MAG: chromosomal replication initiator protein DnaA [Alphaproteobacteria bacterium]|nr:chromosomal replication initiator protein DnaA [Alphaproteobacteria bacterium]MDP3531992.1 chromosomal replication initiator protein DnaA [Alphaproteobacteria bacterium]
MTDFAEILTPLQGSFTEEHPLDDYIQLQWGVVKDLLRQELGEAAHRSWIMPLIVQENFAGSVQIAAPTRFMRDWVTTHYVDRIRVLWHQVNPSIHQIDLIVSLTPLTHSSIASVEQPKENTHFTSTPESESSDDSPFAYDKLSISLDPRLTFDNFVVGKPNELAFAAAQRVAESDKVIFNPLFLYGGVGLGKTHLMHAIAARIKEVNPERKVLYISAEKFMYQFVKALRFKDTVSFKEQFRTVNVLMIDDVQFISGKDSTQEEFFHTFNALVDQNHQIIVSADKSPSDLDGMEERLKSRLGWGLVADIHPTTYELRLSILQAKAENLKAIVPDKVLEFLAHKITSNVRELEGALNRVVYQSTLVGHEINLEMAQELLRDLIRANDRRVTIDEIQRKVAEHYNIRISDMHSSKRSRAIARPRQVAMYLTKQLTPYSYPEIGRKFGGRDHTTVMHASKTIQEMLKEDITLSEDIRLLRRILES